MPKSKTRLMHTYPTERPFYCITGDLSGEGFLVVVDASTHDVVVREGAEAGTLSVIVNPKGVEVKGVSTRPGTRMLDITPSSSDPLRQAAESVERLRGAPCPLRCFNCEEEGHGAADCPHPRRDEEAETEPTRGGAIGAPRSRVERDVAEAARSGLELFRRRRRGKVRKVLSSD